MKARLTVVTANIGRGVSTTEAQANIRNVVRGFKPSPVVPVRRRSNAAIGWQEIDEADAPDEHGILHDTIRRWTPDAELVGMWTACPIVVPNGWHVVRHEVTLTSNGVAKLTPNRLCVQALIEHDDTGLRLVLANGHYPRNIAPLVAVWNTCQRSWESVIDRWNQDGYTVVTTRDRNKRGLMPALSPWERNLLPAVLIDKITVCQARPGPRAVQVKAGKPRRVDLTVDGHNAHGVPLTVTAMPK